MFPTVLRNFYFNSRPSARGDFSRACSFSKNQLFQFTPLREGRQFMGGKRGFAIIFQFTPLREGRRYDAEGREIERHISIHAPPRGATTAVDLARTPWEISIHAPPRGATFMAINSKARHDLFQFTPLREGRLIATMLFASDVYFNSRPSARGDDFFEASCTRPRLISIHAPPRGATVDALSVLTV